MAGKYTIRSKEEKLSLPGQKTSPYVLQPQQKGIRFGYENIRGILTGALLQRCRGSPQLCSIGDSSPAIESILHFLINPIGKFPYKSP